MKKLNELIDTNIDLVINSINDNSNVEQPGSLFVCIEGLNVDGHDCVKEAVSNGAIAIVASKDIDIDVPVIKVDDTNAAMNDILNKYYDNVLGKLKLIGVTGTDGKTTTTSIIYQIINNLSTCGYIGTNGVIANNINYKSGYTTPPPKELFSIFNEFVNNDVNYVAMEVSSERLLTKRIDSIPFDVSILTNITSDHLDKHKTFDNYLESKSKLFAMTKPDGYSIINVDDPYVDYFIKKTKAKTITYGINHYADVMANNILVQEDKLIFDLNFFGYKYIVESPLSGLYNVYNLMAAITGCYVLGFDMNMILGKVKQLEKIDGRVSIIDFNNLFKVIIDYAHTPNALTNILTFANSICKNKIITVTGSAGGRDRSKRSQMGEVVTSLSDHVIFTADDPRHEEVSDIVNDMTKDLKRSNYEIEYDRARAIEKALLMAVKGDIVLIAGRGNDSYMPYKDGYVKCNDYEEVSRIRKQVS